MTLARSDSPFSFESIHDSIDAAVKALPPGAKGGLFIDGTVVAGPGEAPHSQAQVVLVTKIGDHVAIAGGGTWDGHYVTGKVLGQILW